MATYTNDLRLKEIATGDEDGTWGTSTNTNLSLIADAFSYGTKEMTADNDTTEFTIPDGAADGSRSFYLKITSSLSLTATRLVTLGPNTVSKVWIIENATTNSQSITIKQGSGATVTIASGKTAMVYTDGAGAGAAVTNALTNTTLVAPVLGTPASGTLTNATGLPLTTGVTGTLPVGNGGTGATTLTANYVLLGNGTSALQVVAPSTSGNILTSNGTTWTSAAPATGGTVTSVAMSVPAFLSVSGSPVTSSGTLAVSYSGTALPAANGGTGLTSLGTGVATWLGTPSSANLASAVTDETGSGSLVFGTSPTVSGITINDGYTEEVFAVSGTTPALSPTNGSIQTWTLTAASTPTAGTWAAGQSITLMIDDGTAYAVTWTSVAVTWKTNGGTAPTLNTSGYTVVQLWKVGTTIYGARVGDA